MAQALLLFLLLLCSNPYSIFHLTKETAPLLSMPHSPILPCASQPDAAKNQVAMNPINTVFVEEASILISAKKPRRMLNNCAMKEEFKKYADYLNQLNDKRERLVKASRDVTINSKKVIFQVHRMTKHDKEEVLEKAEEDLAAVTDQHVSKLVKELQGTDFWKLRRAYSPGVQEYVEAAVLCKFCKNGTLLSLDEINKSLLQLGDPSVEPLQINILDYLLGVGDVTGELMRLATIRTSDGELEYAETICRFVRDIYRELTLLVPDMDDNSEMKKKMETMLQSVMKIENNCYKLRVRGSEFIPSLGSSDPNFMFLGTRDEDIEL